MPAPTIPTPTLTASPLLSASEKDLSQLHDIHALLDKLFIRNRNQHRRNHWFKSLWQFRKELRLLLEALTQLEQPPPKKKGEKKAAVPVDQQIAARLRYWDEKCVHGWYLHFTQLVAVGPFAVLGLALMASVARVCRITGITGIYEEMASEDVRGVLVAVEEGVVAEEYGGEGMGMEWDEGVLVEREEEDDDDDDE